MDSQELLTIQNLEIQSLVAAVHAAKTADDLLTTTENLAASAHPDGAQCLLEILGFNNPGAAVAAVDGLVAIGQPVVVKLLESLDNSNYTARSWAVRALAGIGDPRGLSVLEHALAQDIGPSVRRAAACGLGNLILSTETELELSQCKRCLTALINASRDSEWVVRYAVTVGLEKRLKQDVSNKDWVIRSQNVLCALAGEEEDEKIVRQRARLALMRLDFS